MNKLVSTLLILLSGFTLLALNVARAELTAPDAPSMAPTWSVKVAITNDTSTPDEAKQPVIAMAPDGGEITIAYSKGDNQLYYRESTNDGVTWGPPSAIHEVAPPGQIPFGDITYDASNVRHAVWSVLNNSILNVVYKPDTAWGLSASAPITISAPTLLEAAQGASNPRIVASDINTLDIVWSEDKLPSNPNILHSRSTNRGQLWSEPVPIANSNPSSLVPGLAVDESGALHVVWEEVVPGSTSFIQYSQGTPSANGETVTWSQAQKISKSGSADFARYPNIIVDGDRLIVSYTSWLGGDRGRQSMHVVVCASECTNANKWALQLTSPQFVSNNLNLPFDSVIGDVAIGRGCIYTYFHGTSTDFSEKKEIIWGVSSCDRAMEKVTDHTVRSNNPSLATDAEWIHLVYEQDITGNHIYYQRGKLPTYIYLPAVLKQ